MRTCHGLVFKCCHFKDKFDLFVYHFISIISIWINQIATFGPTKTLNQLVAALAHGMDETVIRDGFQNREDPAHFVVTEFHG